MPLRRNVISQLVAETTLFVEALGLYIPSLRYEWYEEAIQLRQLRRHATKRWLTTRTGGGSWCNQLLRRILSFAGHVCRQDLVSAKPARILLGHTCTTHSTRLSRPGPWNTVPALLRSFWHNTGFDGVLQAAQDREGWAHLCQSFVQHLHPLHASHPEYLPQSPWKEPALLLRSHVAWVRTVFVTLIRWSFNTAWFDEVDGVLSWKYSFTSPASPDKYLAGLDTFLRQFGHAVSTLRLTIGHVQKLRPRLLPCHHREDENNL